MPRTRKSKTPTLQEVVQEVAAGEAAAEKQVAPIVADDEQAQLQTLDEKIAALAEKRRRIKAVVEQREKLYPALVREKARLQKVVNPMLDRIDEITVAIESLDKGLDTNFRLRKSPVRKPKA